MPVIRVFPKRSVTRPATTRTVGAVLPSRSADFYTRRRCAQYGHKVAGTPPVLARPDMPETARESLFPKSRPDLMPIGQGLRTIVLAGAALAVLSQPAVSQTPWQPEERRASFSAGTLRRLPPVFVAEGPAVHLIEAVGQRAESLQDAWSAALAVDRHLRAAGHQITAAEHGLSGAEASRWPSVLAEGSYAVHDNERSFRFDLDVPGVVLPTTFSYTQREGVLFEARATLPLYTSGRIPGAIDAAAAELGATEADRRRIELDLKMAVAERYVATLRARRDVQVAQSTSKSLSAHAKDVEILAVHLHPDISALNHFYMSV